MLGAYVLLAGAWAGTIAWILPRQEPWNLPDPALIIYGTGVFIAISALVLAFLLADDVRAARRARAAEAAHSP